MKTCFTNAFSNTGFSIAMAICISITSISLRKRRPSSIALSSTTGFVSSTSPTTSPFWPWIFISKAEATWEICFSEMLRASWAMQACYGSRVSTSAIAKRLASELDWPVFSSDETRKTLAGVPLTQRTPQEYRGKVYSTRMTRRTYKTVVEDALGALKKYPGVVLDATFSTRTLRTLLRGECEKANVRFQFVELDIDLGEIKKRLKARDEKIDETSDARLEDFEKLNASYDPPSELAPNLVSVSTKSFVSGTVKAILLRLTEKQSIVTNN